MSSVFLNLAMQRAPSPHRTPNTTIDIDMVDETFISKKKKKKKKKKKNRSV